VRDWLVAGPAWRGWALLGLGLVVAAGLWRWAHRRLATRRLAAALRDPLAARRRAAIEVATEQGLRPFARQLLALVRREHDSDVVEGLVEAVLRNTWEPADSPSVQELRLWAHAERAARASRLRTVWVDPGTSCPEPAPVPKQPRHAAAPPAAAAPRSRTEPAVDERRAGSRHRAVAPTVRLPVEEGAG
jgi:hypothetical protein